MKPNKWLMHIVSEVRGQSLDDHLAPRPDLDFGVLRSEAAAFRWLKDPHARASAAVEKIVEARRNAAAIGEDLVESLATNLALELSDSLPVSVGDPDLARLEAWRAAIKGEINLPSMAIHFPVVFPNDQNQSAVLRLKLYALPGAPGAVVMAPFVNHQDNTHTILATQVGETFVKALKAAASAAGLNEGIAWSLEVAHQPRGLPQVTAWVDGGSVGVAAYLAFRALNDLRVASLDHLCVTGAVVDGKSESVDEVTAKYEAFIPWSMGNHRRRFLADCKPHNPDALKVRVFNSLEDAWTKATDPIPEPELPGQPKEANDAFQASKQVRRDRCEKLYGRTAELDEIRSLVLNKGEGGLVIVHGPAGVGKSSSMSALCDVDYGDAAVIPFFISQRHAETQNWEIIQQTLLAQLKQAGIDEFTNLGDFARDYKGKRVILMVDGIDEAGIPTDALWNWKLSKWVTIVLGVRGTRSQVTERLPIFEQAGVRRSEQVLEFYELGNLKEVELKPWVSELLSGLKTFRDATPEQQEAITGGFWRRTKGYPLFTEYLLRKLLNEKTQAKTTDELSEQVEQLPDSLVAFATVEWLDVKDEKGSAWIATLAAARGPIDEQWLKNLPDDLRPPDLSKASGKVQRWVEERKAYMEGEDSYDLGHPALREAFRSVPDLKEMLASIDAAIAKATPDRLNERASDPDYRWEDAFGLDKYEARYLTDHLESVLECALGKLTTNGNDARRVWRSGTTALTAALGDADHWAGWISEVGIPTIRRQLSRLRRLVERWTPKPKELIELLTDLRDWIDGCGQHVPVGVNPLVLAANHAGVLSVSESARKRLDQRGDTWLCRVSPRTIRTCAQRVTAWCEGQWCKFVALNCIPHRVAVHTNSDEVFVLDEEGDELPGSRSRVFGAVSTMVPLEEGRFAVGTVEGVVAVFDLSGKPLDPSRTEEGSVAGQVTSMSRLGEGFAVGTEIGVVVVFDANGMPLDTNWAQEPSVRGVVEFMIPLGLDHFAIGTNEGVVAVFNDQGTPLDTVKTRQASVEGQITSMISLAEDRFAVGTYAGVVAVFNKIGELGPESRTPRARDFGGVSAMAYLGLDQFAVGTYDGAVAVFAGDGCPLYSEMWELPRFRHAVKLIVPINANRFAVATTDGVVAVFESDGTPWSQDLELPYDSFLEVSTIIALADSAFAVGTAEGAVLVFSDSGSLHNSTEPATFGHITTMALLPSDVLVIGTSAGEIAACSWCEMIQEVTQDTVFYTRSPEVRRNYNSIRTTGFVEYMISLGESQFAVGTDEGVIEVFDATGQVLEPLEYTEYSNVHGCVASMASLGGGCFCVGTDSNQVAAFDSRLSCLCRFYVYSDDEQMPLSVRSVIALGRESFAFGTDTGMVEVVDLSFFAPRDYSDSYFKDRLTGSVVAMISLSLDRFAVGTSDGVVAVFNEEGMPLDDTRTKQSSVSGGVASMISLGDGQFAVGSWRGVVALFSADGVPLDHNRTQEPSVRGSVKAMIGLGQGQFAVATHMGVVAVFDADGNKVAECSLPPLLGDLTSDGHSSVARLMGSERGYLVQLHADYTPLLLDHVGTRSLSLISPDGSKQLLAAFDGNTGPFMYEFRDLKPNS